MWTPQRPLLNCAKLIWRSRHIFYANASVLSTQGASSEAGRGLMGLDARRGWVCVWVRGGRGEDGMGRVGAIGLWGKVGAGAVGVLDHSIQLGPSALCSSVVNIQSHDNNSSNDNNFTYGHKCCVCNGEGDGGGGRSWLSAQKIVEVFFVCLFVF